MHPLLTLLTASPLTVGSRQMRHLLIPHERGSVTDLAKKAQTSEDCKTMNEHLLHS